MKKFFILALFYIGIAVLAYGYREPLLTWIKTGETKNLPLMFLLSAALGVAPVIPFSVFAGIMGAKYGILLGGIINWFGTVSASVVIYLIAKHTFGQRFRVYLNRYQGLHKINEMVKNNAFAFILFSRLIPIIPTPVLNIYSGVYRIPLLVYFAGTSIGKLPGMIVYAFIGNQLFASLRTLLLGLFIYLVILLVFYGFYRVWTKGKVFKRRGFSP